MNAHAPCTLLIYTSEFKEFSHTLTFTQYSPATHTLMMDAEIFSMDLTHFNNSIQIDRNLLRK